MRLTIRCICEFYRVSLVSPQISALSHIRSALILFRKGVLCARNIALHFFRWAQSIERTSEFRFGEIYLVQELENNKGVYTLAWVVDRFSLQRFPSVLVDTAARSDSE